VIRGIHHVGLGVSDAERAAAFYAKAFGFDAAPGAGWSAGDVQRQRGLPDPLGDAAIVRAPNLLLALFEAGPALTGRPPRSVAAPGITHICVQAVAMDVLEPAAARAGASFHAPPTDLGGTILYAYPRDPDGNVIEIEAVPDAAERGAWPAHVSITTPDLPRAVAFYEALLGSAARRSTRLGPNAKIDRLTGLSDVEVSGAWISVGNLQLELWQYHHPETAADRSGPGYSHIAFEAADLPAVRAAAARIGLPLTDGALMEGAASLLGHDPDGNVIAFVAPQNGGAPSIAEFPDPGIVLRVEAARNGAAA